jgi:probable aminopeptidase NPEPL1
MQAIVTHARAAAGLVDTPPTELDPATFAAAAKKRVLRPVRGVKVKELVGDALLRAKLGGIHAVGRCARSAPRLLIADGRAKAWAARGAGRQGRHLRHRRPAPEGARAMETMKSDMGGAAAVLGAFAVLAAKKPASAVAAAVPRRERDRAGAYKPDDVLTLHSGKTVEINNTDAEGRLCSPTAAATRRACSAPTSCSTRRR